MPNIVVPPKHDMTPGREWRTDQGALPQSDFSADDWTVLQSRGGEVAVQHKLTGEKRKLPRSWFPTNDVEGA